MNRLKSFPGSYLDVVAFALMAVNKEKVATISLFFHHHRRQLQNRSGPHVYKLCTKQRMKWILMKCKKVA